ncbi:MAG: bifunctional riboflavin kinase/FAD synthetase [Chloroflexota bacterium]
MQHYWSLEDIQLKGSWLTIGSFDGVHLGHQKLVHQLTAGARKAGAPAVVLTFFPHPTTVVRGTDHPFYLTTPEERARLLGELGADVVISYPFDDAVMGTPASKFIADLHHHLGFKHLKIGHDFSLGKDREGDVDLLSQLGARWGFTLSQVEALEYDNHVISSSRIRFLLGAGQVDQVAILLGRNYVVDGKVVLGDQRGRTIGFPTANLDVWSDRAIPAAGVYVCRITVRGETYDAVTNIGVRPTFEEHPVPPRIEAHILDYKDDIYGEETDLEFISRIRGERKFNSIDELIEQINLDVAHARQILAA